MHPDLMLRVIADRPPEFSSLPAERVEFVRWSPATEVESLQELSIGLMPLEDSLWAGPGKYATSNAEQVRLAQLTPRSAQGPAQGEAVKEEQPC